MPPDDDDVPPDDEVVAVPDEEPTVPVLPELPELLVAVPEDDEVVAPEEDAQRVRALVIPPAWRDVWVTPYANGHLQAVGTDDADELPPVGSASSEQATTIATMARDPATRCI